MLLFTVTRAVPGRVDEHVALPGGGSRREGMTLRARALSAAKVTATGADDPVLATARCGSSGGQKGLAHGVSICTNSHLVESQYAMGRTTYLNPG